MSSIAVLVTLIYLAVQLKQTKDIALRQARDHRANRSLELFLMAAESDYIVPAMTRGEGDFQWGFSRAFQERGLSNEEAMRIMFWSMAQFRHYEALWRGTFDDDERQRMDNNIRRKFSHGLGALYFEHIITNTGGDDFSDHVVELITAFREEDSWSATRTMPGARSKAPQFSRVYPQIVDQKQ